MMYLGGCHQFKELPTFTTLANEGSWKVPVSTTASSRGDVIFNVFPVEGTFSSAVSCDHQLHWDHHLAKNTKWMLYMNQVEKWKKWVKTTI